jgi:hypothetical protein
MSICYWETQMSRIISVLLLPAISCSAQWANFPNARNSPHVRWEAKPLRAGSESD